MACKGAIAAGSIPTTKVGAEILEAGGNAVDALVGACFGVAAGEPSVTSLAGGGMMLYRDGETGEVHVCDFFADAPHMAQGANPDLEFYGVELNYGPTTQTFHVGAGSAATPGVIPGLCSALEKWGSMPLNEVVAPACRVLRSGATLGPQQAAIAEFLEPILTERSRVAALFTTDGKYLSPGQCFSLPALADTLEAMASEGWKKHYEGRIVPQMLDLFGPEQGGLLTPLDFEKYSVRFGQPLSLSYGAADVFYPGLPTAGGPMIGFMLALLRTLGPDALHEEEARILALSAAMALTDATRLESPGALVDGPSDEIVLKFDTYRKQRLQSIPLVDGGPASTTHVSVIDAQGNAAAATFSHGESNGRAIGDSGIMMNNLLGEADLLPEGFGTAPTGVRLSTMMSPTIALTSSGGLYALGTGGANRIRTSITQVLYNLMSRNMTAIEAVNAPRMHFEGGALNAEIFHRSDEGSALANLGAEAWIPFQEPNLYFGGVNLVQRHEDGSFDGIGDARRGGSFIAVR